MTYPGVRTKDIRGRRIGRVSACVGVVGAILATYLLTAGPIRAAGTNPLAAYQRYIVTPLTSANSLVEVLIATTPILFTGLAVAVAFKCGFFNIGAEGQFLAGAVGVTATAYAFPGLPGVVGLPLGCLVGALAGMAWIAIPSWLRTRFGIDEVVTTLLLNPVALLLVQGLLNGPWRNPDSGYPDSPRLAEGYAMPLLGSSRVHAGLIIAIVLVIAAGLTISTTTVGLRARAVGQAAPAARASGIPVARYQLGAALISGAIAGLGGAVQVTGVQHQLTGGISNSYGYTGIVVATLGGLAALGVAGVATLLGTITVGAQNASIVLHLPPQMGEMISSTLLLTVVAALVLRQWRPRWFKARRRTQEVP